MRGLMLGVYKLNNGINVVLDNVNCETFNFCLSICGGVCNELSPNDFGITHFVEHMLGAGTEKYDNFFEVLSEIEKNGGRINMSTSFDRLCVHGRILSENMDVLLRVVADMLRNARFDDDKIEKEKQVILDEYRRYSVTKKWHLFKSRAWFENEAYGHCLIGEPESILSFGRDRLLDWYRRMLYAGNVSIVIVGNVLDAENLIEELNDLFGWIPNGNVELKTSVSCLRVMNDVASELKNVRLSIGWTDSVSRKIENRSKIVCIGVIKKILQDKLIDKVRNQNALSYGVTCGTIGDWQNLVNTIDSETSYENISKLVAGIAKVCADVFVRKQISEEELKRAKMLIKFQNASIAENMQDRRDLQAIFFQRYKQTYNFMQETAILEKLTLDDVLSVLVQACFSPNAILTQGAKKTADLQSVWFDNFK